MNTLSTNHVWILRGGRYVIWRTTIWQCPFFPSQNSSFAAVSDWILDGYDPLYSPRYVIWRNGHWYITPKTPATLSGANRYVIWRKQIQVTLSITWLEERVCLDTMDYFVMDFGGGIGSRVLAEATIPM